MLEQELVLFVFGWAIFVVVETSCDDRCVDIAADEIDKHQVAHIGDAGQPHVRGCDGHIAQLERLAVGPPVLLELDRAVVVVLVVVRGVREDGRDDAQLGCVDALHFVFCHAFHDTDNAVHVHPSTVFPNRHR